MHLRNGLTAILGGMAVLVSGACAASATSFSTNLLVNGDAEADTGTTSPSGIVAPTGWQVTGSFTSVQYAIGNGFPASFSGSGNNFFAGGPGSAFSTASQIINISDIASAVDAGSVSAALSALLGGFDVQRDNMSVTATFLSGTAVDLGSLTIGPITETDRTGFTELLAASGTFVVPVDTRSIKIEMDATRLDGDYNDGYADNLSLSLTERVVTEVPEPGSLALTGAALLGLGWLRRRRAR